MIVDLIDKEQWSSLSADVKGDAYEGLLQKNAEDVKGGAGQYFTPRRLIASIVDVMGPEPKMTICDPACGTGGFLLAAYNYLSDPNLARSYDIYASKHYERVPYPSIEGVKTVMDFVAPENPKIKGMDPNFFVDNSIIKEIEASGFFRELYGK